MKFLKVLFHFLGGIHLAIAIIAIAICTVVAGTLLESKTDSHLLAAQWTYENPLFFFLLSLFFINILFAALRRWPFKRRHIPFLLTHLGLLMIISGTMIKNRFGLQGQLTVWEGSGNQHLLLPHTHALSIAKKEQSQSNHLIELDTFRPNIYYPFHFPQLKCKVIGYAPHVKEKRETWIKGSHAYIAGFPLIPVHEWEPSQIFPTAISYPFKLQDHLPTWSILALRTSHIQEALSYAYLQHLTLQLKTKGYAAHTLSMSLQQAVKEPFIFANGDMSIEFSSLFSEKNFTPSLNFRWVSQTHTKEEDFSVCLQGQDALLVKSTSSSWSEPSFSVDLRRPHPMLCFIEDEQGNTFLFDFDTYGRIHAEKFSSSHLKTLIAYDQGFGGYGVQTSVTIPSFPTSREDKEKANAYEMTMQLGQALTQNLSLSPPLHLFEKACKKAQLDFPNIFVQFLIEWNRQPGFLYSPQSFSETIQKLLKHLDWQNLSSHDQQAMQWTCRLLNQLEDSWRQGDDPLDILERHHWPFIENLRQQASSSQDFSLLNLISQQIASIVSYLPFLDFPSSPSNLEQANFLSAYFRMYDIDYRSLFPYRGNDQENFDSLENYWKNQLPNAHLEQKVVFETPLSCRVIPEDAPLKLEDQIPGIVLEVQEGQNKQIIALAYDSSAIGFKWPILNGSYAVRFQPKMRELPYRVRLRQARQISYPESQQVYSYESDVIISEGEKSPIEQTLSMNRVYETWDGYRFYLAGIGTSADSQLKRIQLAVNYDPAKYFLTYPGILLVFLGSMLLFWFKRIF